MEAQKEKENETKPEVWVFEDADEETIGIETCHYPNGGKSKRYKLSDGREAISHKLKGKDSVAVSRMAGGDKDKYQAAVAATCTKVDGKPLVIEDLMEMYFNDFTKITNVASSLNFL